MEEHEDVSGDVHDRGAVDEAVGQHGGTDGSDHRQPWGRLPPQSPDEERQHVHRRTKIGPRPPRSSHGVRPLPHENFAVGDWGAGKPRRGSEGSSAGPSPSTSGLAPRENCIKSTQPQ